MRRAPWRSESKGDENLEDWLTTYADAITLLMAFFVLLLSMSKIDIPAYEKVQAGIEGTLGKKEADRPLAALQVDLRDALSGLDIEGEGEAASVGTDDSGVVLELSNSAFYRPGSADILPEALPTLQKIAEMLASPRYARFQIEVAGHTDDVPIATPQFPSNWELSAVRATAVVRLFTGFGVSPDRLSAVGLAETRPKVMNVDLLGYPLPENRARNRRVTVRIFPAPIFELPKAAVAVGTPQPRR